MRHMKSRRRPALLKARPFFKPAASHRPKSSGDLEKAPADCLKYRQRHEHGPTMIELGRANGPRPPVALAADK